MEKIFTLLHKHYDQKLDRNKEYKAKRSKMEAMWNKSHLTYKEDDMFAFFMNEIIYQGIINKRMIEDTYFEAKVKMNDYYDTLDYEEKRRLLNYEVQLTADHLPFEVVHGQKIIIPFFDERLNQIYYDEMVLFDIKKYNYYVNHFEAAMHSSLMYGMVFLNSSFCSADIVYSEKDSFSLYSTLNNCLYFYKDFKEVNHYSFTDEVDDNLKIQLSTTYFEEGEVAFVHKLIETSCVKERDIKKLTKNLKRVKK